MIEDDSRVMLVEHVSDQVKHANTHIDDNIATRKNSISKRQI